MFSVKSEKYTESTYHDLLSLTCLYKYYSLQTIPTNLKVVSAEMFHKTIELTLSHTHFVTRAFGLITILAKFYEKVYIKFPFCFNKGLKCSVVI